MPAPTTCGRGDALRADPGHATRSVSGRRCAPVGILLDDGIERPAAAGLLETASGAARRPFPSSDDRRTDRGCGRLPRFDRSPASSRPGRLRTSDAHVPRGVARGDLPPAALAQLAAHPDKALRRAVAHHRSTPAGTVRALAGDVDASVRRTVIRRASPRLLDQLARDPGWGGSWPVCFDIANTPATPAATLLRLASHPHSAVRAAAAANPACPPLLIGRFAGHPDRDVRRSVARRGDCPAAVFARLAEDPDRDVQGLVAANVAAPAAVLARFADAHIDPSLRAVAASNPSCGADLTVRFVADPNAGPRCCALQNRACPPSLLQRHAADPDPTVRAAVAGVHATPAATIAELAADRSISVALAAIENPRIPPSALDRVAASADPMLRMVAARNPAMSEQTRGMLRGDPDREVAEAAAEAVTAETRQHL